MPFDTLYLKYIFLSLSFIWLGSKRVFTDGETNIMFNMVYIISHSNVICVFIIKMLINNATLCGSEL